ncbi:MAG: phage tail tape measure protein [Bacteroidaceae bacterium]|nr:phage tail tape measure protein [Bacteroidaceae bacterium]
MAKVSKSNVFALDTSRILNQLREIEQRAQAADAALINMGQGKKSKPNISAYIEFADVLKTVTDTIGLLQSAMDGKLQTKSLKELDTLLKNMGGDASEFIQTMSELTSFKITDVVDEKQALSSMQSIANKLTKFFGNKQFFKGQDFGFKLDMEVFNTKDIMAQYQALVKAVAPAIQHMSRMVADAGWGKLALDNKFAVTKDVIQEGMEDVVAELDKQLEELEKRKIRMRNYINDIADTRPRKSGGKVTDDDLDASLADYLSAKDALPSKADIKNNSGNKAAMEYLKHGNTLKYLVDEAKNNPGSDAAQFFEDNRKEFEDAIREFEKWRTTNKKYLSQLKQGFSNKVATLDNEILETKEKKKQHYVKATVPNEPANEGEITKATKNTLVQEQRTLSTDLSMMFQKLIPIIEEGGAEAGIAVQKAMVEIFDKLKKAGIDASLESQMPIEADNALLNDDGKEALGLRNGRAQNYNAIAQSISESYNQIQNMTAEEIAADMGQTVIEIANTVLTTLQQNSLSMGVDNGIYKVIEDEINATQAEIDKLSNSVDPIKKKIEAQKKAISTVNKALTPLSPSANAKDAENFLRYSVGQYDAYIANPADPHFAADTGKYGANIKEQLMVRIKQALDDALKQGVSEASLKDLNLDQFDFDAAQQVLIDERTAAEQQIQLLTEENETNLKLLQEKQKALTIAKQRLDMVIRERAASAEEASSTEAENNVPKRPRGRPRKNPKPEEQGAAQGVSVADVTILREEGDKIVSAINQNTDKIISMLGGDNILKTLEMTSAATNDFGTANADEAEAQLKQIYSELKAYRMSRSRGKFDPLYRESKTVAYQKAYAEAQRQGVSEDTLKAYKLNVTKKDYNQSLAALESGRDSSILQTLNTLGSSVKQLADSLKTDGEQDNTKILEAINAITEQMRVCCDNMSAMQDIKPALEPISQISNTLGEILAKVSALGGGEGTSAVDAQKEALKQNLKSYFNEVSKINQKRQPSGAINQQETGSNVYANGKVSMYYGESGSIPGTYRLIDLLSNLESSSVMNIHSHPLEDQRNRFYERTGELWANNTFSLQDIRAATYLKQNGVSLMGEVTGNLLHLMDISQLTMSQIQKIANNYDAAQQDLLKTHPQYFREDQDTGEFLLKDVSDPLSHISASQLLDAALADSISKIGVDPKSIFRTIDITSEAGIDKLANLIIEAGNTVNTALTPFERASQYFMGRNISYASIERMQNGAMTPLEIVKANLTTDMPESKTFDIANESPVQNLLTSISSTLQSIHQSLSAIQTVVASPQNVNREFINDVERNLDIYKYTSPNTSESTHTKYANDQLYAISSNLYKEVIANDKYARDNLNFDKNGLIDSASARNIEIYIDSLKAYLGSLQDRINNVVRDGQIEGISAEDYRKLLVGFNDARNFVANDDLVGLYKQYLDGNVGATTDLNRQSNIPQTLSSILTTLQNIERAINSDTHTWDAKTGEETSFTTRDDVVKSEKNSPTIESISRSITDEARRVEQMLRKKEPPKTLRQWSEKEDPNDEHSTGIYMPNSGEDGHTPPPVTNDIYQLLSSKPYATEATLSKVLAKLEGGIKTSGKDNASNSKEAPKEGAKDGAKESSKKGVSLSPVRGVFKKAETIDNRVAALIAENSALKDTDEYKAYLNSSSTFKGKKEHYLKETNSDETASKRLEESNKYLASIKANEEALKKLAARQKELNALAADPRSKIVSAETVVNAENMEQELMKAAGVVNGIGTKFTLGEKFGTATYEIKDAENHLNKMAIAYDKLNKRFIVTKKSSKAIDPTASRGSADKDEYGIKTAYTSRFKANAKLEASLGSVPNIKETQAYKDYMDAYNKMLEKKNDFFNYSNKTEQEKQELLNIALSAEEAAKNVERLAKMQKEFNDLKARGTVMQGQAGLSGAGLTDELQRLAGIPDVQKANFKIAKDNGKDIQTATYQVEDHTHKIHEMQLAYNRLTGEVVITETRVTQGVTRMNKAIDSLRGKLKQVLTYIASYGSIYQIFNMIRQGITYVKDIDTAITDLKKVTTGIDSDYDKFTQSMSQAASIIGSTTQELITMSAEWARLGYNMKQAGELAKTTAILLNVSEFSSAEEASQALISTIQAYGYAADDSMHVVDILNEVGNNFAISSDGLATALQDSASSLKAGGNSLEQSVALVAAANKVLQDPNSVGSALRTISLRIRGTSAKEMEAIGEDTTGMIQSKSKLRGKVRGLTGGVDILTETGAYKDTYTIIKEIGEAWKDMSDIDQAALLELLAGKNRSNAMAALLTNMEDLTGAYETAMNADGSALRENEKYLDSIQGRIDIFKNAVQTFWIDFVDSNAVKFIVDLGTTGINFLDSWYGKLIVIGGVIDHYGLKVIPKIFKSLKLKDAFGELFNINKIKNAGKNAVKAFNDSIIKSKFKLNFSNAIDPAALKNVVDGLNLDNAVGSNINSLLFDIGEDGAIKLKETITDARALEKAMKQAGVAEEETAAIVAAANTNMAESIVATTVAEMGQQKVLKLTTAEKLKNAIATTLGNNEDKKSAATKAILTAENETLTISEEANTVEKLKNQLAQAGLNAEEIQAIMVNSGLITSNVGLAASFKAAAAAAKAFIASIGPIGWVAIAVTALTAIVSKLVVTHDEHIEKLKETSTELETIRNQINSLQSEISNLDQQIGDLKEKGPLTFTEQADLDRLKEEKRVLERTLALEKEKDKRKSKEVADEFFKSVESDESFRPSASRFAAPSMESSTADSTIDAFIKADEKYQAFYEQWQNTKKKYESATDEAEKQQLKADMSALEDKMSIYQEERDKYDAQIDEYLDDYDEYLAKEGVEWQYAEDGEELEDWQVRMNETLKSIYDIQDKIRIARNDAGAKEDTLARIFGVQGSEDAQGIKELAEAGADTEEVLSKIGKNDDLVDYLEELGLTSKEAAEYLTGISDAVKDIPDEAPNITGELAESLSAIQSKYEAVLDAVDEFNNSGVLSGATLKSLIDNDLLQYLTITENGIVANTDALAAMEAAEKNAAMAALNDAMVADMLAYALNDDASMSQLAQNAIANAGNASITTANQMASATVAALTYAEALQRVGQQIPENRTAGLKAIYNAYQPYMQAVTKSSGIKAGNYNHNKNSGGGSSKSDSTIDWLEHYYELIENKIDELNASLENKLSNVESIQAKNTILDQIIDLYDQKMQKVANAAATYDKRASTLFNSFSSSIQKKIKNGSLDIEKISDENLANDIGKYYDYAKAASEARAEMDELEGTIADMSKKKFDNISEAYGNELGLNQSVVDSLEKQVDLLEERGEQVGTNLYSAMMDQYAVRGELLQQQRKDLQNILDTEVEMGHVKVGSEQWYEMVGTINDLDDEIVDLSISIEECQNAINDIKWDNFDKLIEKFEELNNQLDFLFDRFTDDDGAFDENGNWTDRGIAALGVLTQKMELAQKSAAEYGKALEELERDYKAGLYSENEYFEKQSELTEGQRDAIQNYEDIKDSIVDLNESRIDAVKDSMSKELDAYKKLVDKTKELLNAEKELYNFQKSVNAKKKNITLLEKQIAALTGSNSAEDITRRIKLQAELNEARQELDDEYYEHSMDLTTESLDKEVEYREKQNDKIGEQYDKWLKDREAVVKESFTLVQNNATKVLQEIQRVSEEYGTPIAEEIVKPWEAGSRAIAEYKNQFISDEMVGAIDEFKSMLDGISSKWNESAVAAEEAAKRAAQAVAQQEKDVIAAQNRMVDNAKKTAQEIGSMNNVFSTSSNNTGGVQYTGGSTTTTTTTKTPPVSGQLKNLGATTKENYVYVNANNPLVVFNTVHYLYDPSTGHYFRYETAEDKARLKTVGGSSQGSKIIIPKGTTAYRKYAKGTLGTSESALSIIDELGEELVLNAGPNGRLQYLTKGTSVIPADITKKLMDIALDPTEVLERNRPRANANLSVASNIELNLNIAEVVHIDHADSDAIPDISKAVKAQMDKYMTSINNNLKKYTR